MKESYLFRIYYVDKNDHGRVAYEYASSAEEAVAAEELNEDVAYIIDIEEMSCFE